MSKPWHPGGDRQTYPVPAPTDEEALRAWKGSATRPLVTEEFLAAMERKALWSLSQDPSYRAVQWPNEILALIDAVRGVTP